MIYMVKGGSENKNMITNWPQSITAKVIHKNYRQCKACLDAQSRKLPVLHLSNPITTPGKSTRTTRPGELG